jgi:hypothetical protein
MPQNNEECTSRIEEIRNTLHQAQVMRDVLQAEYDRLVAEQDELREAVGDPDQHQQGMNKMHKAVVALDLAIASMEQGLRKRQQVQDEFFKPDS